MQRLPIAKLNPELSALESKQIKAVVTLIWPYSSSQRHFALLLAEPDFRLRRKKGQVRVRFSGSGARAVATTGVGIGDEVVLSLQGAQFTQEGVFSTPGKSLDWELLYDQTVVAQISRDGVEIATLELINVAPTPAPRSPVRRRPVAPSPLQQWASPAFLKRARLSDGPFFEQPAYDPLRDDNDDEHDKKRRRRSYKDWKSWSYNGRMPSPGEEDVGMDEEDLEAFESTPSRPSQLPKTPISPLRRTVSPSGQDVLHQSQDENQSEDEVQSEDGTQSEDEAQSEEEAQRKEVANVEIMEGDPVVNENIEGDTIADDNIEGDTVANTEDPDSPQPVFSNTEKYSSYDGATGLLSAPRSEHGTLGEDTDFNSEDGDDPQVELSSPEAKTESEDEEDEDEGDKEETKDDQTREELARVAESSVAEVPEAEKMENVPVIVETDSQLQPTSHAVQQVVIRDDTPLDVMPPPTLPVLRTELPTAAMSGMLTPIGQEPTSPTLKPLDSATLPIPSPFPGEHTSNATSYFGEVSIDSQLVPLDGPEQEDDLPSEASYIMETSFFSSISSSRAGTSHPNHESVFTPVRFTFGMDGAGFSRTHDPQPLDLSSPSPEERTDVDEELSKQLGGQDSTGSNGHGELPQEQEDVGGELSEQPGTGLQDVTGPDGDEVPKPTVVLSPSLKRDTGNAASTAEPDNNTAAGSANENTFEGSERHDGGVVELSMSEDSATDVYSHVTESQNTQVEGQGNHSPSNVSPSDLPLEVVDAASILGIRSDESAAPVLPDASFEERGTAHGHLEQQMRSLEEQMPPAGLTQNSATPLNSHSEFPAVDAHDDVPAATLQQTAAHESSQRAPDVSLGSALEFTQITMDEADPFLTMDNSGVWIPHLGFDDGSLQNLEDFHMGHYPEVKMESIEDMSMFPPAQENPQGTEHRSSLSPGEILIEIPEEEHHKVGESRLVSVPDTSPASNTRSKTKLSVSPSKAPASSPKRNTRSMRSQESMSIDVPSSLSPSTRRVGSVISIPDDNMPTSPYYLRSHSRLASSPIDILKPHSTATRQSPPKPSVPRDVDSFDIFASRANVDSAPVTSFGPSQELGLSQGRYSNVAFVDDSEESQRSEDSLSTVQFSGGVQPYMDDEDNLPYYVSQHLEHSQLQMPPIGSPTLQPQPSHLVRASPTPRSVQETSREVHSVSLQSQTIEDAEIEEVASPNPPLQSEETQQKGLQAPSSVTEQTHVGRTVDQQLSDLGSTKLITPEATQHAGTDLQPRLATDMEEQIPLTPQPTQSTSTGLREETNTESDSQEPRMEPLPIDASTPRRNATATDVASPHLVHSPDGSVSDEEETLATAPTQPSIGLSTPLAYYTPLRDLVYFLNRSSQFHSSSNPDILGIVTSDSTPATRAAKGRRDWNTTLHVTDLSLHPGTTTVQVFRAYQNALPVAHKGDVVLLRAFGVRSLKRAPMLVSADESSWCVWRFGKPVWGTKKGVWGEMRAREEVNGPEVERGEGEWMEVDRLRKWYEGSIKEVDGGNEAETETNEGDA